MPLYFYVHDGEPFHQQLAPALIAAWRRRSFEPCRALCASLVPRIKDFVLPFQPAPGESLVSLVAQGLPFARDYFGHLVGELLLYAAAEMPEILTAPDTLCCILAPEQYREQSDCRDQFAPIQQAHYGSRDVVFGGYYRPEAAAYNDVNDVIYLARYLAAIRPETWTLHQLVNWQEHADRDEVEEELEFARERFADLSALYARLAIKGQVLVSETL
jgi:hypothetical protein